MKYVILLGDGMADYPIKEFDGKTPLEVAFTPNMDKIAREGTIGLIDTIPSGMTPGSDTANLSILGYDPQVCCSGGRGPLEAASMGIKLGRNDVAFRCNLVTLTDDRVPIMDDFTAGHISSNEAKIIINDLNNTLATPELSFYPGVGYRHIMVWINGSDALKTTPPHDIVGQPIPDFLPQGEGSEELKRLTNESQYFLKDHYINRKRVANNKKPVSSIWLWGEGKIPNMKPLTDKYRVTGGVISAVDLLKGIGVYAGLDIIEVEGVTGYTDTNYRGKAEKAVNYLRNHDFVFVHVEAPDEMGHEGNLNGKIKAIEDFDREVVGTVFDGLNGLGDYRIMVSSDHPTPIYVKTHVSDPSPFAVYSSTDTENLKNAIAYNERQANNSIISISPGHLFMHYFMGDWGSFVKGK